MRDADYTDDLALLINKSAPVKFMLCNVEQVAISFSTKRIHMF